MLKKSSAVVIAVAIATAPLALASIPASASSLPVKASVSDPFSEEENETTSLPSAQKEDNESEDQEDGDHEDGDHEDSDNKSHDGDNHGVIPPVVIKHHDDGDDDKDDDGPGGGKFVPVPGVTPAPGATPGALGSGASMRGGRYEIAPIDPSMISQTGMIGESSTHGAHIDPAQVPAVDVAGIDPTAKTPADIFMESATIGLTAMGVGAIALGGFAGVRAIRLRKNPLGDYFYDAEKKD